MDSWRELVTFPDLVNEKAARCVAAGVVGLGALALTVRSPWVPAVMAGGFALRVAAGPRFSPLGRLSAQVVAPRLGAPRMVSGAPKRFAQGVGLVFTSAAAITGFAGLYAESAAVLVVLLVCAGLEAGIGFCVGCYVYGWLMRWGIVPEDACAECADIRLRQAA